MPHLLTSLPPVAQGIAIAAGGPVLLWSLWSSARLARAKRQGTAGIDLAAHGLVPRHLLDPSRSGPPEPEAALAVQAAQGGDRRPAAALLADAGEDWDLRWDRLTALASAAVRDGRWLADWRAERPDDPDAAAVHAEALLRQAWGCAAAAPPRTPPPRTRSASGGCCPPRCRPPAKPPRSRPATPPRGSPSSPPPADSLCRTATSGSCGTS
ncbi:hypothetical protein [Streptomyces sp. CC228A]|uniref:hypothetical protein n=1 Tax=Streptomyces sp. CC228A TaxID=2898186 RepID=UPI001F27AA15|nr:hypothetical protein [Streptomyces sp. CC228A]